MNTGISVQQLENILEEYHAYQEKARHNDLSDLPKADRQGLVTRGIAAVNRIAGSNSQYATDINRLLNRMPELHLHTSSVMGVVQALRDDIKLGYIQTLAELIHGEVFADFLEMAQHLFESGYKDAAAVIVGSTLESHLRKLCAKNGISLDETKGDGSLCPKKADRLNADLAKANIYSKLDQKSVTAWLDIRNKAAHGKYMEYSTDQVTLFLAGVREFISRKPA